MKKTKKVLFNMLCVVLLFSVMVFGMTGCGTKQQDERNGRNEEEKVFADLEEEDDRENDTEDDIEDEKPVRRPQGNTFNNVSFQVEEDGSLVIFDDDLEFVWYQDASDQSINYFGGPSEVYYGEDAYDYITRDYADNGVYRKKSVFNFSEEKMAEFFEAAEEEPIYARENMICMILHHEDIVVEDEYQEELDNADGISPDTYYWGFYDGNIFMCYNIESGSLMTWIPVEGGTDEGQIGGYDAEDGDDSGEGVSSGKDSHSIEVGSGIVTLDIPEDAEDVFAESYTLTYYLGGISVDYSDSFCELSDDAMEELRDSYDIFSADEPDNSSNIEPKQTKVGKYDAYYCRAVSTYSDGSGYVFYCFLIDIGEDNYLDVTLSGDLDELTEERAFELADVKLR